MPTYTYECTNKECLHQFELEQSVNDIHEATCQKCGINAKRIFQPISSQWNCKGAFGKSSGSKRE